jgi:hypothetical protein
LNITYKIFIVLLERKYKKLVQQRLSDFARCMVLYFVRESYIRRIEYIENKQSIRIHACISTKTRIEHVKYEVIYIKMQKIDVMKNFKQE